MVHSGSNLYRVGEINRAGRLLVEGPLQAAEAPDALRRELRERRGREVEVPRVAAHAAVDDRDGDGLALVYIDVVSCMLEKSSRRVMLTVDGRLLAADGVVVGVAAGIAREAVEEHVRRSGDVVGIMINPTTCVETGSVVGTW